jgi:hypothetical protein
MAEEADLQHNNDGTATTLEDDIQSQDSKGTHHIIGKNDINISPFQSVLCIIYFLNV